MVETDAFAASKALFGGRAISCPSRQHGAWLWLKFVEDQVSAEVGSVVWVSKHGLMARGVAVDLLQMAK